MRQAVAVAFPLGLLAAVNPCAFPMLPAYLALFAGGRDGARGRLRAALGNGLAMTAGFVAVFGAVGAAASAVLGPLVALVPGVVAVLGAGLLVLGVATALGRSVRLPLPAVRFARGRGPLAAAGFGAAYAVASLGCALPLLLAAEAQAGRSAGWAGDLVAGLAYALGMGALVTGLGLVVARVGVGPVRRMTALGRVAPVVQGVVVAVAGTSLLLIGLGELGLPVVPPALDGLQAALAAWLSAVPALTGAVLGAVVVAGLAALAAADLRGRDAR